MPRRKKDTTEDLLEDMYQENLKAEMEKPKLAESKLVSVHGTQSVNKEFDPDTWEFHTMDDYDRYNKWARRNKIPVKVPTEDFWPKVEVKFMRLDGQPSNVLKARIRNKFIDWKGELIPNRTYHLATPVVKYLNALSEPIYGEVPGKDGTRETETKKVGDKPRFACQVLNF